VTTSTELDGILTALADPHRRRVVDLLAERPESAGALAASVGLTPPAMSRHLRVLRRSGLVQGYSHADDARVRIYSLRPEPFVDLNDWLDDVRQFWTDQLGAFKDHVESR
jgi:DNA-binding transcriptional ArsR family regulator